MNSEHTRDTPRAAYTAPTITRVHLDPVNELLMATGTCFQLGNPQCTNTNC
jgi:hypothetical protein